MAAQWYLQQENGPQVEWAESHPERRECLSPKLILTKTGGILTTDCYASSKAPPQHISYATFEISAATLIRNSFPSECWYLSTPEGTPTMNNPIRQIQDRQLQQYWSHRSSQSSHPIHHQGASTYILHRASHLSTQNQRN